MNYEINDIRSQSDFKGISFSKCKKSNVKTELVKCLSTKKIESACYWAAELICAGHLLDLWDCIILYIAKDIHIGCPRLPVYISARIATFKDIVSNGYVGQELRLRNNIKVRQLFSEIIGVLCYSNKKHSYTAIKVNKDDEFNMTYIASKLVAPDVKYARQFFKKEDPKELFIAINEFSYHIVVNKSSVNACYWLEWIMEFESRCKKKKIVCECERRTFPAVMDKYQVDPIWIVWDVLLGICKELHNPVISKIVDSLLNIYCIRYTSGVKRRRRYILYFAISLLTEPIDVTIPITKNQLQISKISQNTDVVYKDVKKNEIAPATGYLELQQSKSNLDKTIEKLDKMKELENL